MKIIYLTITFSFFSFVLLAQNDLITFKYVGAIDKPINSLYLATQKTEVKDRFCNILIISTETFSFVEKYLLQTKFKNEDSVFQNSLLIELDRPLPYANSVLLLNTKLASAFLKQLEKELLTESKSRSKDIENEIDDINKYIDRMISSLP